MVKPEWGAKHSCPKCGTRFYDLGKDDPVACIDCGNQWYPEPVLKSKQPIPFEELEKEKVEEAEDADLDEDLDIDEDGDSPDNDVDLGGDDDLGVRPATARRTTSDRRFRGNAGVSRGVRQTPKRCGKPLAKLRRRY
jgi:uncharacterized protein (TIGR02300 family)